MGGTSVSRGIRPQRFFVVEPELSAGRVFYKVILVVGPYCRVLKIFDNEQDAIDEAFKQNQAG